MDKISGIIPASPRVTGINKNELPPVRAGAPGFGRPEAKTSVEDRVSLSSVDRLNFESDPTSYARPRNLTHRGIADRVTQEFFETKAGKTIDEPVANSIDTESIEPELEFLKGVNEYYSMNDDLPVEFHLEPLEI